MQLFLLLLECGCHHEADAIMFSDVLISVPASAAQEVYMAKAVVPRQRLNMQTYSYLLDMLPDIITEVRLPIF